MKKLTMILVCVLLIALIVAPAFAVVEGDIPEGMQIAYFVSTLDNGYHQADSGWAIKYAKDQYDADVTVFDGKSDNNVMAENCDTVLANAYDMASIFVWEGETIEATVQDILDSGTVCNMFYQTCGDIQMPFISVSEKEAAFEMGKVAAEKWMEWYPDKPIVYAVIGWMENPTVDVERTYPFIDGILSVAPDAKEAALLDAAAGTEAAYAATQDLLQSNPDVNIIYGEASSLTIGIQAALSEANRGVAKDGVCETEILVSTDAPETELKDIFDPTKSLKITMGMTPKDNAIARIDNLMQIYLGEMPQDELVTITTSDYEIDYWNSDPAEAAEWFNDQYNGNITLD